MVLTLVNLGKHFDMLQKSENLLCESDDGLKEQVIVVEFNQVRCGVMVDDVHLIARISWQ